MANGSVESLHIYKAGVAEILTIFAQAVLRLGTTSDTAEDLIVSAGLVEQINILLAKIEDPWARLALDAFIRTHCDIVKSAVEIFEAVTIVEPAAITPEQKGKGS